MTVKQSNYEEIHRLLGALDDHKTSLIDKLNPSLAELEITAAYLAGMDDIMGEERQPLTGKVAKIYEVVTSDELPGEEEYRLA